MRKPQSIGYVHHTMITSGHLHYHPSLEFSRAPCFFLDELFSSIWTPDRCLLGRVLSSLVSFFNLKVQRLTALYWDFVGRLR